MKLRLLRAALALSLSTAAAAQGSDAIERAGVYDELVMTIFTPENLEPYIRRMIDTDLPARLRADAGIVDIDGRCRGYIDALARSAEPVARQSIADNAATRRARLAELFSSALTEREAAAAVAFFTSPLGRRYSASIANNATYANSNAELATQDSLSGEALEADLTAGEEAARAALSNGDRSEIERIMATERWAAKLSDLSPAMTQLNVQQMNGQQMEEYSAKIDAAMEKAAQEHLATCGLRLAE